MNAWFESSLNKKLVKYVDYMTLSLLWLVFSLPIVTIGASFSALYATYYRTMVEGKGQMMLTFLQTFRQSFKQATLIWVCSVLVTISIRFYLLKLNAFFSVVYWPVMLAVLFLGLSVCLYALAQVSRFDQAIQKSLSNAFILSIGYLPQTVLLVLLLVLSMVIVWLIPILIIIVPTLLIKVLVGKLENHFLPLLINRRSVTND